MELSDSERQVITLKSRVEIRWVFGANVQERLTEVTTG